MNIILINLILLLFLPLQVFVLVNQVSKELLEDIMLKRGQPSRTIQVGLCMKTLIRKGLHVIIVLKGDM